MISLIRRFTSAFGRRRPIRLSEREIDTALGKNLNAVRSSDPDTQRHWLRLRNEIQQASTHTIPQRPVVRFALAGAVAVVAVGIFLTLRPSGAALERYVTARGEQSHVELTDGSDVTLSHTSELVVQPFRPGEARRLSLSGEAYFRVQKKHTPFIVTDGVTEISVLGTEFNVRTRNGELEVAVLRGTVRVERSGTETSGALILTQGQRAGSRPNGPLTRIDDVPSAAYPGWRHNTIYLTRSSLADACREIEARFDVTVQIPPGDAAQEITGILAAPSAENALEALCQLTGKNLSRDDRTYTLR